MTAVSVPRFTVPRFLLLVLCLVAASAGVTVGWAAGLGLVHRHDARRAAHARALEAEVRRLRVEVRCLLLHRPLRSGVAMARVHGKVRIIVAGSTVCP